MTRGVAVGLAKYGLGFGLLGYVLWANWRPTSGGPGIADAVQQPIDWPTLGLAVLVCAGSALLTFLRWYVLVTGVGFPFTVRKAIRLGMAGMFLSSFLPGSVGGDILKAVAIAREQSRRTVAVATVLCDRVVGLWALFWLAALLGGLFWVSGNEEFLSKQRLETLVVAATAVAGSTTLFWLMLGFLPERRAERFAGRLQWLPKIGLMFAELWRAVWLYRQRPGTVITALFMSMISHTGFVVTFHLASHAFHAGHGQMPSLIEHFLVVPAGMMIKGVFPSPGGVGGGEYGFGKLYAMIGYPESAGVLASLALQMIFWGIGLAGYLVYLRMPADVVAAAEAEPASL